MTSRSPFSLRSPTLRATTVARAMPTRTNTLIFYQKKYHWGWFIPLDEEIVSVGIVIPSAYFLGKGEVSVTSICVSCAKCTRSWRGASPS